MLATSVVAGFAVTSQSCHDTPTLMNTVSQDTSSTGTPSRLQEPASTPQSQDEGPSFDITLIDSAAKDESGWQWRVHQMQIARKGQLEWVFADLRDVSGPTGQKQARESFRLASPFAGEQHLDVGDVELLFGVSPDWSRIGLRMRRDDRLLSSFEARLAARAVPSAVALTREPSPFRPGFAMHGANQNSWTPWFDIANWSWNGLDTNKLAQTQLGLLEGNYTLGLRVDNTLTKGKSVSQWPEPVWWLSVRFVPDKQ